ncbi:hypothetical protein EDC96DRAFT_506661 [Choanephora cucurbitarum]|nr:hypothetical protein EDC96DRAFT_506661 [Choanephora cucurbitarum]
MSTTHTIHSSHTIKISVTRTVLPTTSITMNEANDRAWLPPLLGALTGLILITMVTSFFYCRRRRRYHCRMIQQDSWHHTITQPPPAYTSMREKSPAYSSMREKSSSEPVRLQYAPQLALSPSFTDLSGLKETASPVVRKIELYDPKVNLPLDLKSSSSFL